MKLRLTVRGTTIKLDNVSDETLSKLESEYDVKCKKKYDGNESFHYAKIPTLMKKPINLARKKLITSFKIFTGIFLFGTLCFGINTIYEKRIPTYTISELNKIKNDNPLLSINRSPVRANARLKVLAIKDGIWTHDVSVEDSNGQVHSFEIYYKDVSNFRKLTIGNEYTFRVNIVDNKFRVKKIITKH
ncbi:MAG: hypothetical protein ACRC5M_00220 [Anaeroplasmataceae bacterium]